MTVSSPSNTIQLPSASWSTRIGLPQALEVNDAVQRMSRREQRSQILRGKLQVRRLYRLSRHLGGCALLEVLDESLNIPEDIAIHPDGGHLEPLEDRSSPRNRAQVIIHPI